MDDGFAVGAAGNPAGHGSCIMYLLRELYQACKSFYRWCKKEVRTIWGQRGTRKLFLFVLLLYSFLGLELLYGYLNSSLAFVALMFYTNTNAFALFVSLTAVLCTKHQATRAFSYGFQRLEVIMGFTDGVFHTIAAFFITIEALEHIIVETLEPPQLATFGAASIALIGLVLNLVGCLVFHSHKLMHSTGERKVKRSEEFDGIFWNVITNILTSLGVICSSVLVTWDMHLADSVMSIVICTILVACSFPLARNTGRVLLQSTPKAIDDRLHRAISEASAVEGVLECKSNHFWTQAPGEYVGSLHVRIKSDVDEQVVLAKVSNLFSGFISNITIQIEKEDLDECLPYSHPLSHSPHLSTHSHAPASSSSPPHSHQQYPQQQQYPYQQHIPPHAHHSPSIARHSWPTSTPDMEVESAHAHEDKFV